MSIVISPVVGQESARELAQVLGWEYENPYVTGERNFTKHEKVFKYGFSRPIKAKKNSIFNKTEAVELSRNKIKTLASLKDSGYCIEYTSSRKQAEDWLKEGTVVARSTAEGSDGEGLTYCENKTDLKKAPAEFWTKYIEHTDEFRVNVWRGVVLSIYEKRRNGGFFKFCLWQGQEHHPQLVDLVTKVYKVIGLDFCGLDILRDDKGRLHLLEVNSAPILLPYTLKKLVKHIQKEM